MSNVTHATGLLLAHGGKFIKYDIARRPLIDLHSWKWDGLYCVTSDGVPIHEVLLGRGHVEYLNGDTTDARVGNLRVIGPELIRESHVAAGGVIP